VTQKNRKTFHTSDKPTMNIMNTFVFLFVEKYFWKQKCYLYQWTNEMSMCRLFSLTTFQTRSFIFTMTFISSTNFVVFVLPWL